MILKTMVSVLRFLAFVAALSGSERVMYVYTVC